MDIQISTPIIVIAALLFGFSARRLTKLLQTKWQWPAPSAYIFGGSIFFLLLSPFLSLLSPLQPGVGALFQLRSIFLILGFALLSGSMFYLVRYGARSNIQPPLPLPLGLVIGSASTLIIGYLLYVLFFSSGNTALSPYIEPTAAHTNTPPSTNTPVPAPTSTLTPTPTPDPYSAQDGRNDGLNCATGESTSIDLPPSIDIINISVRTATESATGCSYQFIIELAEPPSSSTQLWGGIQINDPTAPSLAAKDQAWYFNNFGNHVFEFAYSASEVWTGYFLYVDQKGSGWFESDIPSYPGSVEDDRIKLDIPCDYIDNFSEGTRWIATTSTSDDDDWVCDYAGMWEDEEGLPLPLAP